MGKKLLLALYFLLEILLISLITSIIVFGICFAFMTLILSSAVMGKIVALFFIIVCSLLMVILMMR